MSFVKQNELKIKDESIRDTLIDMNRKLRFNLCYSL